MKEFGERLSTYPIDPNEPLSTSWGYEMQEGEDLIISISIAAANATGDLKVTVELADEHERSERLRTSFLCNYPDLDRFKSAIAALMNREAEEAALTGR